MNYFYITGTSKGLGNALSNEILETENNFVFGLSRTKTINHKNYSHIEIDLNNFNDLDSLNFEHHENAEKIVLINNAGVIGEIKKVGDRSTKDIISNYNINSIAPSILMNKFINKYQNTDAEKTILNISSGAGRHTIESWATYCASKAALDMYSQVIFDEQKHFAKEKAIKIYSIAPGIVDTPMQDEIRKVNSSDFPIVGNFINYKNSGSLSSPEEVSKKLIDFINNSKKHKNVIYDVREI
jgi:benzil reductase ((S)-benzoin forming)